MIKILMTCINNNQKITINRNNFTVICIKNDIFIFLFFLPLVVILVQK